jgi:hypothetical protein
MKQMARFFGGGMLALMIMAGTGVCLAAESERVYRLPTDDMTQVLEQWLEAGGFQIHRLIPEPGQVVLLAEKDWDSWRVILIPTSPIATRIEVWYFGADPALKKQELWDHLALCDIPLLPGRSRDRPAQANP